MVDNRVLDVAAVTHLRDLVFERVVLVGDSGGGLAALCQAGAGSPAITATPAGDPPDLTAAELPPTDALVTLMAHPGLARRAYSERGRRLVRHPGGDRPGALAGLSPGAFPPGRETTDRDLARYGRGRGRGRSKSVV